jgi:opacity protein-like surface antigen
MLRKNQIAFLFYVFFLLISFNGLSQERIEGGFFLGASYYNGDLNPGGQFYRAKPAIGGLIRVAFNHRLALKGTFTAVEIEGVYPQEGLLYPAKAGQQASGNYSFERTMADISTQIEFNFFEYNHLFHKEETRFTPYLSGGLASTIYKKYPLDENGGSEKPHFILSLPFGIGVKWKPSDWVHVGLEWTFRKTFVDDLDFTGEGSIDPSDPYGFHESSASHNNDWYSIAGLFVTFDLFHRRVPCNAGF